MGEHVIIDGGGGAHHYNVLLFRWAASRVWSVYKLDSRDRPTFLGVAPAAVLDGRLTPPFLDRDFQGKDTLLISKRSFRQTKTQRLEINPGPNQLAQGGELTATAPPRGNSRVRAKPAGLISYGGHGVWVLWSHRRGGKLLGWTEEPASDPKPRILTADDLRSDSSLFVVHKAESVARAFTASGLAL
jgi:hypothetical protein